MCIKKFISKYLAHNLKIRERSDYLTEKGEEVMFSNAP